MDPFLICGSSISQLLGLYQIESISPPAKAQETYAACKEDGWLATDSVEGTITHEFGHAVHFYLEHNGGENLDTLNEFIATNKKSAKNVSKYATTNDKESIAEAFASYHHNPKPSLYARKLRTVLTSIIH